MGRESRCVGRFGRESGEGKLLLETKELIFRGAFRLNVPLKSIASAEAKDGELRIRFDGSTAFFDLGKPAEVWAKAIREPKGLLDKLGLKAGQRVAVLGIEDDVFVRDLKARGASVTAGKSRDLDHLFFGIASEKDLRRIESLKSFLRPDGALWVVRPKGPDGVSEAATRAAGLGAGLVDVKVVAFSETRTAEKFVIPVAKR
jgi:hypothetical protein